MALYLAAPIVKLDFNLWRNLFWVWQNHSMIHFDVVLPLYGCFPNGPCHLDFHTKRWYGILACACACPSAWQTHHSSSQNTPVLGWRCEEPHYAVPSIPWLISHQKGKELETICILQVSRKLDFTNLRKLDFTNLLMLSLKISHPLH